MSKVTDVNEIAGYGVFITPGLVVDGEVKLAGKVRQKTRSRSYWAADSTRQLSVVKKRQAHGAERIANFAVGSIRRRGDGERRRRGERRQVSGFRGQKTENSCMISLWERLLAAMEMCYCL